MPAMIPRSLSLALLLCGGPTLDTAQPAARPTPAAALAGDWIFFMTGDAQPQRVRLTLDGDSLRGRVYGQPFATAVTATREGPRVAFAVGDFRWRARVRNDSLIGQLGIAPDSSAWVGVRDGRRTAPRSVRVTPTTFSRSISAQLPPVVRIGIGDTVITETLDAGGWGAGGIDERAAKRSPGGNPLTGPFLVDGALPGDVLLVTLHRVRPNRAWAFSGTQLVDNALEPSYAAERSSAPGSGPQDNRWLLDTVRQEARLRTPPAALADYRVPLTPFLGVVATAPALEHAPSSRESGSYGGNMENRFVREGATIELPVRVTGGFFYLGDGHAAQGDGELAGDALETSLDVTFSVQLRRFGFRDLVRIDDAESRLSVGTGGSLDEAMRRATSDMARWLRDCDGLTPTEASIVLGLRAQYVITDVVPPGFGVSLRLPKLALPATRGCR